MNKILYQKNIKDFMAKGKSHEIKTRYNLMMENKLVPLIIFNSKCKILDLSPAAASTLGYLKEELLGRDIYDFYYEAQESDFHDKMELLKKKGYCQREAILKDRNGNIIEVELYVSFLYEDNYLLNFVDLTERKKSDSLKDEFISTISHELRNPLATIRISLELLNYTYLERLKMLEQCKSKEEKLKVLESIDFWKDLRCFKAIASSIDQMSNLVNDLLDLTRIDMGKITLRKEKIYLAELLLSIVGDMQILNHKHNFVLDLEKGEDYLVIIDPVRFKQIILNLLSNAIKHSPPGKEIKVVLKKSNGKVIISITDQGPGIPAEEQEKVFERFYMGKKTKELDGGGLGLGLHICKRLVELHQGEIWLESQEGKGTTFYVSLPSLTF